MLFKCSQDRSDLAKVIRAADKLGITEYDFFHLAFRRWTGHEPDVRMLEKNFVDYMFRQIVPHWVRHYARRIIALDEQGQLDGNDPHYHRYDPYYRTFTPNGVRSFLVASSVIIGLIGGGILLGHYSAHDGPSVLPPYFDKNELKKNKSSVLPWQRD